MKYLAIGSGAMGIYSFLGYIYKIKDQLHEIEEISGASAGAMIGLLLSTEKDINEINRFIFNIDFKKYYKFSMKNFIKKYGFINLSSIKEEIIEFLGANPKFKDLKKKLIVAVFNISYSKTEYLSVDTHPEMRVLDAVTASMSIPFIFTSKKINSSYYIDGGIFDRIPVGPFLGKSKEEVIAIQLDVSVYKELKITNLKDYLFLIYFNFITKSCLSYDKQLFNIVDLQRDENISLLDFKMNEETKMKLFFLGFNSKL